MNEMTKKIRAAQQPKKEIRFGGIKNEFGYFNRENFI